MQSVANRASVQGIRADKVLKHLDTIIVVLVLAVGYISTRFDCLTGMETITALERKIAITRTDVQKEKSIYMSTTCEKAMQARVDSLGLGLSVQERPPFRISLP